MDRLGGLQFQLDDLALATVYGPPYRAARQATIERCSSVAMTTGNRAAPDIFQTLPEDRAVAHFGEERIAQARDEVKDETPAAMAELEPGQLAPSCFAVPFAFEKNNVICSACPFRGHRRICSETHSKPRRGTVSTIGPAANL